ncbi:hypothetical protein [Marinobacterium weihaiense]|uniref:Lipoprotein n=1 Tax=Marinobacterium weihaiense TaxID=2851016 RepID=A0ABS6M650_9GAMM|nr:hypothetical protein [Marinobacterium weihaiense]MBV0931745.1 hypothetical protein [Marinobacterium weihaiense]
MKKAIACACLAVLAANAQAGVKEKKAQRAAEENISTAVESMKSACGNAELSVNVDWAGVDGAAEQNADIIKDKGMRLDWVYAQLGDRTAASMEALGKICSDDADYKAAIAEISMIQVQPKPKFDDYKSAFSLDGSTLTIENGWYMTRTASDFRARLINLF